MRQTAPETERRRNVAAHLIHEWEVDALQVVVTGALDEERVKGMVGSEECVRVVGLDLPPHLFLQLGKLEDVSVVEVRQCQLDGQLFQCFPHSIGIEELLRRERADDCPVSRAQSDQTFGGQPAQGLSNWYATDV